MRVEPRGLFQSSQWADQQKRSGHGSLALDGGTAFLLPIPLFKRYAYLPRGFAFGDIATFKQSLHELARETGVAWVRIEPTTEAELEKLQQAFPGRIRVSPHEMQPRENLVADITLSGEDLLATMKAKTRYNIRLAEKSGVTTRFSREDKDIERFLRLVHETAERKGIAPHGDLYYRNFFHAFGNESCTLALAEHEGTVLAANLLVFHEGTAYYLHGGSSSEKRELMAPFLLHFAGMLEARRRGATRYDFGGVRLRSKQGEHDTDWDGITRFKTGFAPAAETEFFPGTYDIVISPLRYRVYLVLRALSKQARVAKRFLLHR